MYSMNILFINPSLRLGSPTKYLPVGIASVMTYAESKGYYFDFLDIDIDDLSDSQVERELCDKQYDVVLTGSIVTHYKWIKWLSRVVRRINQDALIVVGNSVAGSIPEIFLKNSEADIAVIGEAEITICEILDRCSKNQQLSGIKGTAYKSVDGKITVNERRIAVKKLDELPMIDWRFFDTDKYFEKSYAGADGLLFEEGKNPRVMPLVSARGCVFRCTFCHFVFWNDPYRYRSPENIVREIERNVGEYGINYVNFWDDLSFGSLNQAERLADALISAKVDINWNAAVRTDLFGNPKFPESKRRGIAEKFRESGCLNLGFSLESANEEILVMMEKKVRREYFLKQVEILRDCGITSSVSVVFGYPIETEATINETFSLCEAGGIYPSIGYLLPLPATGMYEYAINNGFILDQDKYLDSITERQDLCLNMTTMPDEQVLDAIQIGAERLNSVLNLGLGEDSLIRTGSYRNHTKETADDSSKTMLRRIKNDVSFNYSQSSFDNTLGHVTKDKSHAGQ